MTDPLGARKPRSSLCEAWGGGPLPKAVVEGFDADPSTIESSFDGPPPHELRSQGGAWGWRLTATAASAAVMTALDVFVFLLLIGGAAVGFVRGFVHEVISLAAWIVGIAMLKLFHTQLWGGIERSFDTSSAAAAVLAFAILFLPSFVIVKLLARSLGHRTRRSPVLGPFDRVLGGGFGMLKGLLGVTLFFLLANLATDMVYGPQANRPEWMTKSRTYPLLFASGRAIVDWVEARRHKPVEVKQ